MASRSRLDFYLGHLADCTIREPHARQFLGFSDCQARSAEVLDSHVNASLMALNLAKATLQEKIP